MTCGPFSYYDRWLAMGPLMGLSADVTRKLEQRDRDLEAWLNACGSSLPKSWCANTTGTIPTGSSLVVTTPTLTGVAQTGLVALANVIITNPDGVNPISLTMSGAFQLDGTDLDTNLAEYATAMAANGQTTRHASCLIGSVATTAGYVVYNNSGVDIYVQLSVTVTETNSQSGTCCNVPGGGG